MKKLMNVPVMISALTLLTVPLMLAEHWPEPIKSVEARDAEVLQRFDAPNDLQVFPTSYDDPGIAPYLTENGEQVLVGNMLNAQGKEMLRKLERSTWIADGSAKAPRIIYTFSDPNCRYCNIFWKQARPWVEAGDVQIRHVMVGMLRQDSVEKAAALLNAKDQQAALHEYESAGKVSKLKGLKKIPAAIQQQLQNNLGLMAEMGVASTPAIFYPDKSGQVRHQRGAPSPDVLKQIMGPRS